MANPTLFHKIIGYFCVIKTKSIKKTSKIVGFIVASIFLFFVAIYALLENSSVQQIIVHTVVEQLSEKLHTRISVGKVNYKLFNTISLTDLYLEDQHRDTLLFVDKTDAHFSLWRILTGKVRITSLELDKLTANLKVDSVGHSNIEFIIKAFSKPQKKDTTAVEYQVKSFKLINSRFSYFNARNFKKLAPGQFNANDINVSGINADIALNIFKKDTVNLDVNDLQLIEKSGLTVTKLTFSASGLKHGILIPQFLLQMPGSDIRLHDLGLKYKSTDDFKDILHKVRWNIPLDKSVVTLSDLSPFVPAFAKARSQVSVKGLFSGRISNLRAKQLEVKYKKSFLMRADVDINGLPDLSDAFTYLNLHQLTLKPAELQDLVSQLTGKPFVLPGELTRLGTLAYKGNITGFLSNLVAYGNLHTDLGSVSTDILLKLENHFKDMSFNGAVKTTGFQLGTMLKNKELGKISFAITTKGEKKEHADLKGSITALVPDFSFKNYVYHDIRVDGHFDGKGFDGSTTISDPNIQARFEGLVDLSQKKMPVYNFSLKVDNANLQALNIIKNYKGAVFSLKATTNLSGPSVDNLNGSFSLDSIQLNYKNKRLNVDKILIVSRNSESRNLVSIESDYVNGTIDGSFKLNTMGYTVRQIMSHYLPSFAIAEHQKRYNPNLLKIDLSFDNLNEISDILEFPYSVKGQPSLKGYIDESKNKVDIQCNIPTLQSEKQFVENIFVHLENPNRKMGLTARALMHEKAGPLNVFSNISAYNDSVYALVGWQNSQKVTNAGEINTVLGFRKQSGGRLSMLRFNPSQIIINDSVWNVHKCIVDFNADSTIHINNFSFDNNKQFVHVNGIVSHNEDDHVKVELNDVNLDFVFGLLKLRTIWIGGSASGSVDLFNLMKQPVFEANLQVKKATLNHKPIGDATIHSTWDRENKQIRADAVFTKENKTVALAGGVYVPGNDSLDFTFNTRGLSLAFLNRYFESVVSDFDGNATGKIRLFGESHRIRFEARAFVRDGQATVKILNTPYYFNDSVILTPHAIELKKIKIKDKEGNSGTLTGTIHHSGGFGDMKYDLTLVGKNIMAMNTTAANNDYFFGKAYASGNVHIFGNDEVCNIWVDVTSQPHSKCFISMGSASSAADNSFITFINKRNQPLQKERLMVKPVATAANNKFNVKVNLQIGVTPDAEMELVVDPKGGDVITGRGEGNLRVEFDSYSPIKLYGTYTIQNNGYYLFTLQNLIRRDFKIDKGSTLSWTGDPFHAQVNVKAIYQLTASLKDLDQNISTGTRTNVPVNCILKLTDDLMKPTINFDIDLPQSEESMKQQVKSIISTEEMMNRQVLYLMVFNKFYTPEYMQTAGNSPFGANDAISFGLSTLSGQFNNWLSKAVDNVSFSFDYKKTDAVTNESQFSTQLLYQPNNRVIINGNFGYTTENANVSNNTNRFIGDVDMEYLLTESGKFRLKAYNHSVNRTYTQARTTQGVGFLYKEDFQSPAAMMNYYWRLLSGKKKTDENEDDKNKKK